MRISYKDVTDEELASRAAGDDDWAFEELVLRHQSSVLRWIGSIDRRSDRVEDLAQETFIKAWRARGKFRGESSWRTWILRIALRVCLDRKRRYEPRTEQVDERTLPDGILLPELRGMERVMMDRSRIEALRNALDGLDNESRAILVLKYTEGYNAVQIGNMISRPPGTVRRILFKARQTLRSAMISGEKETSKRNKI